MRPPVLEVGSQDVNGSVRGLCPEPYTGVDIVAGRGVDRVILEDKPLPFPNAEFQHGHFDRDAGARPVSVADVRADGAGVGAGWLVASDSPWQRVSYHNPPDRYRFMPGCLTEIAVRLGLVATETSDPQVPGVFLVAVKPPWS